jgi:hypothetical protein
MNHTHRLPALAPWEHWPAERLRREQQENPRSFARGFQMRAFTDEERLFPSFKNCYSHGVALGNIQRSGWPTFMGVDLAGATRAGNVIFAASIDPTTQRRYPLEIRRGAWTSPETARNLAQMHASYPNVRHIMVENNGYQQSIIDWIRNVGGVDASFWYKIESFTTGANKHKVDVGLPSLEVEFANKAWVIPADEFEGHPPTCQCGWCVWTTEMNNYPMSGNADSVMACWFCREAMSRWGGVTQGSTSGGSFANINVR